MNKQGFSSLLIIIILASIIFFILAVIEVTAGFSSRSAAESTCMVAGESILSEYQKELFELYGLLALQSFDQRLTRMGEFYIEESLASEGANILDLRLLSCDVSSEKYPALDVEAFSSQIQAVSAALLAKNIMSGSDFSERLRDIKDAVDLSELNKKAAEKQLESLGDSSKNLSDTQDEEDEEGEQERKQARSLMRRYKEAMQIQDSNSCVSKEIAGAQLQNSLPSNLLGALSRTSLLSACMNLDVYPASWLENEYILNRCSYATALLENSFIDLEAEYILFGQLSDKENEEETRSALFWLRSALNMAYIYSSSQKRAEVTMLASSAFALIPTPLAFCIISGIWAAVEAKNDVDLLFKGKCVPFFKSEKDWKSSLSGEINHCLPPTEQGEGDSSIGAYDDYLRLFLLLLPKHEKLARLMDVIQLNIANQLGRNFCFRDYAYGISLNAEFEKAVHLPGSSFVEKRTGIVEQEHAY